MLVDPSCAGRHYSRVSRVVNTTHVELERPLPWDLYTGSTIKELHVFRPSLSNFGVQGLRFEMLSSRYEG